MTPTEFIAKWQASTRNERAACQEHFIDLCRLLGEPTPNSDPTGEDYRTLDAAVAAAYGWPADLPDDDVLSRLLELNPRAARRRPTQRLEPHHHSAHLPLCPLR